jgi:hypothetical protein
VTGHNPKKRGRPSPPPALRRPGRGPVHRARLVPPRQHRLGPRGRSESPSSGGSWRLRRGDPRRPGRGTAHLAAPSPPALSSPSSCSRRGAGPGRGGSS